MDIGEPRVRRRGFFLHSDTGEPETGELENPEGFVVRVRVTRSVTSPKGSVSTGRGIPGARFASARHAQSSLSSDVENVRSEIRSGSVTGSRQRGHLPR